MAGHQYQIYRRKMTLVCERKLGIVKNYFLNTCYIPKNILGAGDTAINKADKTSFSCGLLLEVGVDGKIQ